MSAAVGPVDACACTDGLFLVSIAIIIGIYMPFLGTCSLGVAISVCACVDRSNAVCLEPVNSVGCTPVRRAQCGSSLPFTVQATSKYGLRIVLILQRGQYIRYPKSLKRRRTESYKRVQFEPSDVSMSLFTCSSTAVCVRPCWKRSRSWAAVCSPSAAKQGRDESGIIGQESAP